MEFSELCGWSFQTVNAIKASGMTLPLTGPERWASYESNCAPCAVKQGQSCRPPTTIFVVESGAGFLRHRDSIEAHGNIGCSGINEGRVPTYPKQTVCEYCPSGRG